MNWYFPHLVLNHLGHAYHIFFSVDWVPFLINFSVIFGLGNVGRGCGGGSGHRWSCSSCWKWFRHIVETSDILMYSTKFGMGSMFQNSLCFIIFLHEMDVEQLLRLVDTIILDGKKRITRPVQTNTYRFFAKACNKNHSVHHKKYIVHKILVYFFMKWTSHGHFVLFSL